MRLIIISGLSGSGKSVALNVLEDLDFYCIDNVPAATLDTLITQVVATKDSIYDNLAVGVDARNRASDLGALPDLIHDLRGRGIKVEVIFLHAGDDILLKRYSETRRKHPLSENDLSLLEAIARERELLGPIIDCAELVIDTTRTNVYELRASIRERIGARTEPVLSILIESFGYKHGIPSDADFVFDLRCLPNPYWETHLRPFTGINRNYLTIALGCTGGQHRSVYMTEKLAAKLGEQYKQVLTRHNELPSSPDNLRQ
jgi:UPF0042 nucleotide-binding protein